MYVFSIVHNFFFFFCQNPTTKVNFHLSNKQPIMQGRDLVQTNKLPEPVLIQWDCLTVQYDV